MRRALSIRKLVKGMFYFLLLPMSLMIIGSFILRFSEQREQAVREQKNILRIIALPVRNELDCIDTTMEELTSNNIAARSLSMPSKSGQIIMNSYVLRTAMDTIFNTSPNLNMMILYFPNTNILLVKDDGFLNWKVANKTSLIAQIKASYINEVQSGVVKEDDWCIQEVEGRAFLRRDIGGNGVHCMALLDIHSTLKKMAESEPATQLRFSQNGNVIAQWPEDVDFFVDTKENMSNAIQVYESIRGYQLERLVIIDNLYGVDRITVLLWVLSVILIMLILILMLIWHQQFQKPMNCLVNTMHDIAEGDLSARAELLGAGEELRLVNKMFNQMLERIQQLKIERYEQELRIRQTKLSYYQAQIRPHFYLNCLKNLYSLAQQKDMQNIEESILLLSKHLRYCFQWHSETVTLQEELDMCNNYIDLVGLTTILKPEFQLDVDTELLQCLVPPVSVLTLVENSLKFGMSDQRRLQIRITARLLQVDETTYYQIGVYDSGPGFTVQQLSELNGYGENYDKEETGHVGIQNVIARFRLIYGEQFEIAFSNQDGACVELFIQNRQRACRP